MRLGHILRCIQSGLLFRVTRGTLNQIDVRFGTLSEIRQRSKTCILCQQWVQLVDSFPGDSEEDNDVTLTLNWEEVHSWLQECVYQHGGKCGLASKAQHPPGFRLIDVTNNCVVTASGFCEYAALSYVRGTDDKQRLEATTHNIRDLQKRGSMHKACLPATICDAMRACAEMGIQYLWVDRLCIVQNHAHEKDVQINSMGTIYTNAYVTLVGLEGNDVNYGLAGLFKEERPSHLAFQVDDLVLTQICSENDYGELVRRSEWDSRGWAYQEALLSRRLLLFSHSGLFYECCKPPRLCGEPSNTYPYFRKPLFNKAIDQKLTSPSLLFPSLIEGYTKRVSSHESDILRAISGILNSTYESNHYFGLTFALFENAILWKAEATTHSKRISASDAVFPSWSWSSVKGGIKTNTRPLQNLAVWITASSDSNFLPQPLKVIAPQPRMIYKDIYTLKLLTHFSVLLIMAWKEGCFSGKLPDEFYFAETWSEYKDLIEERWGVNIPDRIIQDAHGLVENVDYSDKFSSEHISKARSNPGGIMVHTQALRLRLVPPRGLFNTGRVVAFLDDESVNRDWFLATYGGRQSGILSCPEDKLELSGMTRSIEKMIYGNRQIIPLGEGSFIDAFAPIVNLMVIDTHKGVSRRVALTKTYLKI
ncbi:heterokaryon incompatibility protein-domain-containing protein [Aspergillus caelatus]|uniref:Heterokaryon incompatibility protein-domain-containing protein n=1 Tax=Aspergillus caelatus TaxID=61420 RepID=A0A5N6ZL48_9EURO|nr:heterokaryon incompatibility protein-domain-containing protein [Aspergillus caelatus]KAE8357933.1 heterokaryon incompatibility protein-domain-containing protein [Aspergillus caelatus]